MIVARFEEWPPEPLDSNAYATLMFGDGSQKGLAAFVVWLSIILVWRNHEPDSLRDPLVQGLICSLMRIPTSVRASEVKGSHMEASQCVVESHHVAFGPLIVQLSYLFSEFLVPYFFFVVVEHHVVSLKFFSIFSSFLSTQGWQARLAFVLDTWFEVMRMWRCWWQ